MRSPGQLAAVLLHAGRRNVMRNVMHIMAAALCLALACWELHPLGFAGMVWPDAMASAVYMAALAALPFVPVPACTAIVIVTFAEALLPSYGFVQSLWGFCYAMIVFAAEGLIVPAVAAIAVLLGVAMAQGAPLLWGVLHQSIVSMLPFMAVALALGWSLHLWRAAVREQERAEAHRMLLKRENAQYRERLELLHQLHGSVAGSLAYAILLCRDMESANPAALPERARQVEGVVAGTLESLRREVIDPTRRLVDAHGTDGDATIGDDRMADPTGGASAIAIDRRVHAVADRLSSMGFRCETLIRGDLTAMDPPRLDLIGRIVDEIGNNILKYGAPGPCAITIRMTDDGSAARIWSGNRCAAEDGDRHRPARSTADADALSGGTGLPLLRRSLAAYGGTLHAGCEDGEWSIAAELPG